MERTPQSQAIRHLSELQKSILHSLSTALHRRHRVAKAMGVPYLDVVHAVAADKPAVTAALCQLMRRGLVLLFLPPGAWSRWVALTEQGQECVKSLVIGDRQPRAPRGTSDVAAHSGLERRQRSPVRYRDRQREKRQRKDDRRTRQRFR